VKPYIFQVVGGLLIALGEYLAIYSELLGVKCMDSASGIWKAFLWITLAGVPLIAGYILAYKGFGKIWPVSVISVVAILLSEPVLNIWMLNEQPTTGAIVGFILGAIGLVCALTF
jgi:hypothetical protein